MITPLATHLKARPRLYAAAAAGLLVGALLPDTLRWTTRGLVAWNVAVWLYLVLVGEMMLRADQGHIRRVAVSQAQGAAVVLAVVVVASVASVVAIVVELAAAKGGGDTAWPHLLFVGATVVGSWLLLPVLFALDYASRYYRSVPQGGLLFPGEGSGSHPDYVDFLYFAFTIAVALQTADVSISARAMRRLVLLQALLSFAFNTTVLALTVNIAASLF